MQLVEFTSVVQYKEPIIYYHEVKVIYYHEKS